MALTKITPQMFDTSATAHDLNVDNGTFVVDGSASRVGIGKTNPSTLLDVNGTATATTFVGALTGNVTGNLTGTILTAAQTNITSVGTLSALAVNSGTTNTVATFTSSDAGAGINLTDNSGTSTLQTNGANLRIGVDEAGAVSSSAIQFRVDGSTKATLDSSGNLTVTGNLNGISTTQSVSGNRWGVLPEVASNGVLEIGRYLDFHATDGDTSDYGARFDYDGSKMILTSAFETQSTIKSSSNISIEAAAGNPQLLVKTAGAGNNPNIRIQADSNYWDIQTLFSNAGDELDFRYNGSSKLIIDKDGNVGIGVTPSTLLSSSYKALQIGLGASIAAHTAAGNAMKIGSNMVYEGTAPNYYDKYLTSATAAKYELDVHGHKWYYAASGTAGNAISWSQVMQIDSSGVLLLGPDAQDIKITPASFGSNINSIYLRGNASGDKSMITLNHYGYADYVIGAGTVSNGLFHIGRDGSTANIALNDSNFVGINTSTLNKVFNMIDPAQGGEQIKLHFEASSGADKWAIYSYDRTNGHYTNLSFGENTIFIKGSVNAVGIRETDPDAFLHVTSPTATSGSGDHTTASNISQIWENSAANGFPRVAMRSAHTLVNCVYNFETGKNAYWGEATDTGTYYFRGRDFNVEHGDLDVSAGKIHVKSGANSTDGALRIESAPSNIMDMGTDGTGHFINCVNTDPFRIKFAGSDKFTLANNGNLTTSSIDAAGSGNRMSAYVQDMFHIGVENHGAKGVSRYGASTTRTYVDGGASGYQGYVYGNENWIPEVFIPYSPNQVYRISVSIYQLTGSTATSGASSRHYLGLAGYDENFNFVNVDSITTFQYNLGSNVTISTGNFYESDITLKGWQGAGQANYNKMDQGTVYIRPLWLCNYQSTGGTAVLTGFSIIPAGTVADNDSNAGTNY